MEHNIGVNIRRMRIEREMTQEELANFAGVSFQAVSKWETGITMPDIALLPRLAELFGVRIDDLFGITDRDEFARVERIIDNEKLTDENFAYAKKVLDKAIENTPDDPRIIKMFARLYLAKNQQNRLFAGKLLRQAMKICPDDGEIFQLYAQVCGINRSIFDSGCGDFISDCEAYLNITPKNTVLYELLIPALIETRQFVRTKEVIALYERNTDSSMPNIFRGDIELSQGNIDDAVEHWSGVSENDHKGQYEIGERFLRICDYKRAETAFERSFVAAEQPRDLSSVYSLAFMYDKLNNRDKATKMWRRIIDVLASDWNTTNGETVEWAKREIERLKNLK